MLLTNQGEMASDRGGGAAAVLGEERQCGAWETGRSGFVHPSSQRLAYLVRSAASDASDQWFGADNCSDSHGLGRRKNGICFSN